MHLVLRDITDTVCPPAIPNCKPSIGPGPAMGVDQSTNTFIRQPNATDNNTEVDNDAASEAEINTIGVVVIVVMLIVLFSLWAGLAQWPRGKIRGWWKYYKASKVESIRRKARSTNADADKALTEGTLGVTASAVNLTQADIESAVGKINARVAGQDNLKTLPPKLEKNVSQASTLVAEELRDPVKHAAATQDNPDSGTATQDHLNNIVPAIPSRAFVRGVSFPKLPFILPGSPFGSMKFPGRK